MSAKVYFSRHITKGSRVISAIRKKLPGKVAVKLHSGEKRCSGQAFL